MPEDDIYNKRLEQQELLSQIQAAENIAKNFMTREAIQRYGNLKLTHQTLAIKAILIISKAAKLGQLKQKIDDQTFKNILSQIKEPKQEFKILKK